MQDTTDESLMGRISSADHQAFSVLVRRHSDRFYRLAYRLCGREEEAEDIVQDAFLKIWDRPQLWQAGKGARFTTWFYRVVSNQALDVLRKRRAQAPDDAVENLVDERPDQERALQLSEEQVALERALGALPERQKLALNLCMYEDLSNKEAADIMGIGIKALESLLMRAKAGLKDELIRSGFIKTREKKHG